MRYSSHRTGQEESLTLSGNEFMERFSWHVVEKGFRMVCYYGFLSPSKRDVLEVRCTGSQWPVFPVRSVQLQ